MNERLSLQDLTDLLSKKQEITKKEAEAFLRELVTIISENIENNEPVKIKDFGTFKLVKVNARKSVDVNTGEAIEIAAHYKLSFTPDKSLKEAINKPFAHFESVLLEDGVSFENIEQVSEDNPESSDETDIIEEDITEYFPAPEETVKVEGIINTPEEEREAESAVQQAREEAITEPEKPTDNIAPVESTEDIENETEEHDIVPLETLSDTNSTDIDSMFHSHRRKTKRRRFISLGFIVFLIIAGFAAGGYYFQELATFLTGKPAADDSKKEVIVYEKKATTDSVAQKQDSVTANIPETEKPKQEPPVTDNKKAEDTATPLATETIKSGHTLRNISLKYYGHKSFWIYIYEENKGVIKNPNNVPLGTKLIIPAPAKYGIDAKNPASVEKAKQKEAKLFSEMGL